jgi:photosystem II stability/assembly factor-like uncharacterized protein
VVLLAGSALVAPAAGHPTTCEAAQPSYDDWRSIAVGPWPSGPPQIVDYAVDFVDTDNLLATNGSSIVASHDAGCTWENSLDLATPNAENVSLTAEVVEFTFFAADNALVLVDDQLPVHHPAVLYTDDGGNTWTNIAPSLAQVRGRPLSLTSGGGRAYLLIDPSEGVSGTASLKRPHRLYVSEDGGATWTPTEEEPPGTGIDVPPLPPIGLDGESKGTLDHLESNPNHADELWLYGSAGVYRSKDGGTTAAPVHTPAKAPVSVTEDVAFSATQSMVSVYSEDAATLARSVNEGPYHSVHTPTQVESASWPAIAGSGGVFVETALDHVVSIPEFYADLAAPVYRDVSPRDGRQILDVNTVFSTYPFTLYGRTATTLERYDSRPPPPPPSDKPIFIPRIPNTNLANLKNPRLFGARDEILLHPGESRKVRYTLYVPPTPTPLDVFFLIDTSSSMQGAINGVRAATFDIIQNLRESGNDVWFGVGQYRSYTSDPAYDRVLDMSEPGPKLSRALNSLEASQGGLETQLAALYQVATGAGQNDHTSSLDAYIKPGQQANFREGSLRVIVHATDEEFSEGRPHPGYGEVEHALAAKGIQQIGISLEEEAPAIVIVGPNGASAGQSSDPGPGLREVAAGTGTIAPPQGVDCNGDGVADIAYQQPIVCSIPHDQADDAGVMGAAIVNTLNSLSDFGEVDVEVSDDPAITAKVNPAVPTTLDFKETHDPMPYIVKYHCPHLKHTRVAPMTVSAIRAAGVLAGTRTTVTCKVPGDPAPHPEKHAPPIVPFLAPLVPLVPIPPRPPDVPGNPNPNPQPNPQAQAQAQGAFAAQEEKQPQLAYAHDTQAKPDPAAAQEDGDKFAFSRFRQAPDRSPLDPLFILAAAAMTCAAGAALVRQRTQSRIQTARATRGHYVNRRSYGRGR